MANPADRFSLDARFGENASRLVSYLLVAGMMACAALTIVNLVMRITPASPPWYLGLVVFLAALERLYTYRSYSRISLFTREWLMATLSQWVVILLALRLIIGLSRGVSVFLADLSLLAQNFFGYVFVTEFFFSLLVVVVVWVVSGNFAAMLDEMGLDATLLREEIPATQVEQQPVRERMISLIFSVGTLLIVLTAMVRFDLRAFFGEQTRVVFTEIASLQGGGASTLMYFMLAIALLSQSQFLNLHARWSLQRVPVNRQMAGRWAFYSVVFLALLAAFASLLPTSYSLGLLATLGYLLDLVGYGLFYFAQFLLTVLVFLISLPFLLFGRASPVETPSEIISPPEIPALVAAGNDVNWLEALKSAIFWVIFLGVVGFSLWQYLRQHQGLIDGLRKLPGWTFFARAWDWLRSLLGGVKAGLVRVAQAGTQRWRARRAGALDVFEGGFLNLRRLDPRQRVFFFYQAFLRRSGETGLPRSLSQTPSEFATSLDRALPEAEPDIDTLTAAFVEARYAPRPVEPERVERVRQVWEHLRKVFQGKKKIKSRK